MSERDSDSQSTELYRSYRDLCAEGFEVMRQHLNEGLPKNEWRKVINKGDHIEIEEIPIPNFHELVSLYKEKILGLPQYQRFSEAITNDNIASRHFDTNAGIFLYKDYNSRKGFVLFVIAEIIKVYYNNNRFDENLVDTIYQDLVKFLRSDTLPVLDIVPLDNFNSDIDEMPLDEGVLLRKISEEETESFLQRARDLIQEEQFLSWRYVIQFRYQAKKLFGGRVARLPSDDKVKEILMPSLLKKLRVFKKGLVGYNFILGSLDLKLPFKSHSVRYHDEIKKIISQDRNTPLLPAYDETYVLTRDEISDLHKFMQRLQKIDYIKINQLRLAIDRFNYSYSRQRIDDKVIDFAVCLEALCSKENDGTDSHTQAKSEICAFNKAVF